MAKMTPQQAAKVYESRCALVRAQCAQGSREYAQRMSDACREYEESMRAASKAGDTQATSALAASAGPYLNGAR